MSLPAPSWSEVLLFYDDNFVSQSHLVEKAPCLDSLCFSLTHFFFCVCVCAHTATRNRTRDEVVVTNDSQLTGELLKARSRSVRGVVSQTVQYVNDTPLSFTAHSSCLAFTHWIRWRYWSGRIHVALTNFWIFLTTLSWFPGWSSSFILPNCVFVLTPFSCLILFHDSILDPVLSYSQAELRLWKPFLTAAPQSSRRTH